MGFFERIKNNETRIYKYAVPKKNEGEKPILQGSLNRGKNAFGPEGRFVCGGHGWLIGPETFVHQGG